MGVPGQGPEVGDAAIGGSNSYVLDGILARRVEDGSPLYLCKWENYAQQTWESLDDLVLPCGREHRGSNRDKVAVDAYFDDVLLTDRSSPSSGRVPGVDYSQYPSCLLVPWEMLVCRMGCFRVCRIHLATTRVLAVLRSVLV